MVAGRHPRHRIGAARAASPHERGTVPIAGLAVDPVRVAGRLLVLPESLGAQLDASAQRAAPGRLPELLEQLRARFGSSRAVAAAVERWSTLLGGAGSALPQAEPERAELALLLHAGYESLRCFDDFEILTGDSEAEARRVILMLDPRRAPLDAAGAAGED